MEQVSLEVKNLKKYFNTPKGLLHAVDNVNFRIYEGKTLGVVGESGCGKSTLGRVILHLLDSTDGQILFEGEDVTHFSGSVFFSESAHERQRDHHGATAVKGRNVSRGNV